MSNLENNLPNLENEFLKGLRNRTVIGKIQNQVIKDSKILPHVEVLTNPGDAVTHKAEITDEDKLIFYTVFSEPIEKIAVGDKASETVAKQAKQVAYDIADFYDEEFVQNFACDLSRYHENAIVKLNANQLQNIQLVGEIAITTGYQMVSPSTSFNKRGERCNVRNTKEILCFVDNSLYGKGQVASIYQSPSPTLEALERIFTVIPCNMVVYDETVKTSSLTGGLGGTKNILTDYSDLSDKTDKMTEKQAKE
ncbi:14273_t:CDS:2 [Funneliformis geosporum]|nr:14273_t:CDS:2 [Funneliformis geosporum]